MLKYLNLFRPKSLKHACYAAAMFFLFSSRKLHPRRRVGILCRKSGPALRIQVPCPSPEKCAPQVLTKYINIRRKLIF
ncbi:hypothetical protein HanRHA438_Chr11g0481001 [Helianthus annuus]|nr:hypothetical protein HanRHA438_Chr11g0481001 [Helianthus annuus]